MLTKTFKQLKKSDTGIAGGKGASLGEMTRTGIPVPPGFVILTEAFENFLDTTDLRQDIRSELNNVDNDKVHTVETASKNIQALILNSKIPDNIQEEIKEEFKKLDARFVAVRSSATAEDGLDHAWAGQLDSFLNVTEDNLIKSVQKCWASLFTPRAIFYRLEKGLQDSNISVAVVVQTMVNSDKSGIAFSVHPVTEDYNQMIIEAGFGLGEAIVSGSITPDAYVVSKKDNTIIDINVNNQIRGLYRKSKGGNEWVGLNKKGEEQVLSEKEILELSDLIKKIEDHYGVPQDIEWAQENRKFYITQSRPITTLSNHSSKKKVTSNITSSYEKHQRDYSLLFASVTAEIFYTKEFEEILSYRTSPLFFHIEDEIFCHFIAVNDYSGIPNAYFKNNSLKVFQDYINKVDEYLVDYNKFANSKHSDSIRSLATLHGSIKKFIPILMIVTYAPDYLKNPNKDVLKLCLAVREKYENVLKEGIVLEGKLLNTLERKLKIKKDTLQYLTNKEYKLFIKTKELPKDIINRKKFFFCKYSKEGEQLFTKNASGEILNKIDTSRKIKHDTDTINGNIAYPGKTKGRVRIIRLVREAGKLKKGEILIASMTDPRYLPAMKKAAAIVTDEGGITCHAAIVSRELKIPCVIGTKIATQVLKDGDLVEVDADKGIVRILKK